jgi:hypothetical protein
MSRLLARLQRVVEALPSPEAEAGPDFPTFPTEVGTEWESQTIEGADISTIPTFPTPKQGLRPDWAPEHDAREAGEVRDDSGADARACVSSLSVGKVGKVGNLYAARISFSHCGWEKVGKSDALPISSEASVWLDRIRHLRTDEDPCPGFRSGQWAHTRASSLSFIESFGELAISLGWTVRELFGVDPKVGIVRVDNAGALMITGRSAVVSLTADEIGYADGLTHRPQPRGLTIPVWEYRSNREKNDAQPEPRWPTLI